MICTQLKKIVKIYNFQTSSSLAELGPAQPQLVWLFDTKFSRNHEKGISNAQNSHCCIRDDQQRELVEGAL